MMACSCPRAPLTPLHPLAGLSGELHRPEKRAAALGEPGTVDAVWFRAETLAIPNWVASTVVRAPAAASLPVLPGVPVHSNSPVLPVLPPCPPCPPLLRHRPARLPSGEGECWRGDLPPECQPATRQCDVCPRRCRWAYRVRLLRRNVHREFPPSCLSYAIATLAQSHLAFPPLDPSPPSPPPPRLPHLASPTWPPPPRLPHLASPPSSS